MYEDAKHDKILKKSKNLIFLSIAKDYNSLQHKYNNSKNINKHFQDNTRGFLKVIFLNIILVSNYVQSKTIYQIEMSPMRINKHIISNKKTCVYLWF